MTRETMTALLESAQNMYALVVLLMAGEKNEHASKLIDRAQAAILAAESELK